MESVGLRGIAIAGAALVAFCALPATAAPRMASVTTARDVTDVPTSETVEAVFDPATITVTGLPGDVLGRTSVLKPGPGETLDDVKIIAQDLVADDTVIGAGVAIQSSKLSVVPSTIGSVGQPITVSVTVSTDATQRAGTYKGDVVVLGGGVEMLRLPLVVTLVDAAKLEFDAAGVTMQASKGTGFLSDGGGKGAVSLNNNGLGTATNLRVMAGAFQSESASLPAEAVTATADTTAPPGEVTIAVEIEGDGIAPGKYMGSVAASADGIARITKPVTLNVKASAAIAILMLAVGVALGWLFIAWSSKFGPRLAQADAITDVAKRVAAPESHLMRTERRAAQQAIHHGVLLYNTNAQAADIAAALERATKLLTEAQASYESAIGRLEGLFDDADKDRTDFNAVQARRNQLVDRIEAGEFATWAEALTAVTALETDVEAWRTTGAAPAAAAGPTAAFEPELEQILERQFRLKSLRLLVTILAFIVLVLVGYATLYGGNATFGAEPGDYINLILFGSVVEALWGKNVKLSDLKVTYTP